MMNSLYNLSGKRVVVVGGASGMGAAAAKLSMDVGAEVIVLDVAQVDFPVSQVIKLDLRDRASINDAIASIEGNIDIIFACAGVADGVPGIMLINFIGQRYLIESLLDSDRINKGGAILMISSVAGLSWESQLNRVKEFLACDDWESAVDWVESHPGSSSYLFSKQAINTYVATRAFAMLKQGIRINAVMPGPTNTPLARANADMWLGFGKGYREALGVEALQPEQIAGPMLFLASPAAAGINGINLLVDYGHVASALVDSYREPMVKMLVGRP